MKFWRKLFHNWLPNFALALGIFLLIRIELMLLAFILFGVSKWQVLLGGHRLWIINLRDQACDILIGISFITGMAMVASDTALQLLVASLFMIWLLFVKPLESIGGVGLQALVCQFMGLSLLFLIARDLPQVLVIISSWFISTIAMNHFLSAFQRPERSVISLIWGLLVAELSWLTWRWLITYSFLDGRIVIPQIAVLVTIMAYTVGSIYKDHAERNLRKTRLIEYVFLSDCLLLVVIIGTDWVSQV